MLTTKLILIATTGLFFVSLVSSLTHPSKAAAAPWPITEPYQPEPDKYTEPVDNPYSKSFKPKTGSKPEPKEAKKSGKKK